MKKMSMKVVVPKARLAKVASKTRAPKKPKGLKATATTPKGLNKELKGIQKQAKPKALKY